MCIGGYPIMSTFHDCPLTMTVQTRRHAIRRFALAIAASASLTAFSSFSHIAYAADPVSLSDAIAGPQRSDANRARDAYRHPAQTLTFFGLTDRQTVIEIAPGAGWYTEILAPYLSAHGKLYEAPYIESDAQSAAHLAPMIDRFRQKLAQDPADYSGVTVGALQAGRLTGVGAPGTADMVLTFRNIHNWIKDDDLDANFKAFYTALKPGGVLGVEEHRAKPGTSLAQTIVTGYVTEDFVIEHARAAGFELAGRSEINDNPRDTKDYPKGVWTLPPTYAEGNVDRARYAAIGESDRMTLRFVKPVAAHKQQQ
jgi:predicted methyltransferase